MAAQKPGVDLGLERAGALGRPRRSALPGLIFPLDATVIDLALPKSRLRLGRASFALVPADMRHVIATQSPAPRVVTLLLGELAVRRAWREYRPHFDRATYAAVVAEPRLLPRTRWVDELTHRYLFERHECERHESAASRFLETELTKELYFLGREHMTEDSRASVIEREGSLIERARRLIDAELLQPLALAELARRCHASPSTLLRAFARELGLTPIAYLRERRLDEAFALLESGLYSVGEVAARIGYQGPAAFTTAFRRKFRVPPSQIHQAPRRPRLPAHGQPPTGPTGRRDR